MGTGSRMNADKPPKENTRRVVIMGVSGSGKSLVGQLLADELGAEFVDADDLHPRANTEKMTTGQPLTDTDREPWLGEVGRRLASAERSIVIACSALKRSYRDAIRQEAPEAVFIHLSGSPALLHARMSRRPGHFMPITLLESQLETIEELHLDENGKAFDISGTPAAIAAAAARWLAGSTTRPL